MRVGRQRHLRRYSVLVPFAQLRPVINLFRAAAFRFLTALPSRRATVNSSSLILHFHNFHFVSHISFTMRFTAAVAALAASLPFTTAYWKGFNIGANNADGSCKTTAQWTEAFNKLKGLPQHITSVRLYASSDCNTLANAVPAAKNTGVQILVGVWAEDNNHFNAEKQALLNAISAHGKDWILAISVGSEDLYRKDTDANTLANKIYDVRGMVRSVGVQAEVGHVDTWNAWVDGANAAVIKASDFIGMDG